MSVIHLATMGDIGHKSLVARRGRVGERAMAYGSVKSLTVDRLRAILDYDPITGVFRWKAKTAKWTKIGTVAGAKVAKNGYRYISIDRTDHLAQRLAWLYVHGTYPQERITFKNGDRSDIRLENLGLMKPGLYSVDRLTYNREHRKAYPLHYRNKELQRRFGVSLERYEEMFVAQGGVCAICSRPETAAREGKDLWLAVDHDHKTGAIRGLLCSNCNRGVGCFGDDRRLLHAAADYLDKYASGGPVVVRLQKEGSS